MSDQYSSNSPPQANDRSDREAAPGPRSPPWRTNVTVDEGPIEVERPETISERADEISRPGNPVGDTLGALSDAIVIPQDEDVDNSGEYPEYDRPNDDYPDNDDDLDDDLGLNIKPMPKIRKNTTKINPNMSSTQKETFWDQLYSACFATYNMIPPSEPLPCLEEMREIWEEMVLERQILEDNGEEFVPTEAQELVLEYRRVLELYFQKAHEFSKQIELPMSVQRRIVRDPRPSDAQGRKTRGKARDPDEFGDEKIPECNCPHCWWYTEDYTAFMEHLFDQHARAEAAQAEGESPTSVYSFYEEEPPEQQPEGQESQEEKTSEHTSPGKQEADVPESRKDSGYDDTMTVEEEAKAEAERQALSKEPVHAGGESEGLSEEETPPKRQRVSFNTIDPRLTSNTDQDAPFAEVSSSTHIENVAAGSSSSLNFNVKFWKKLLEDPFQGTREREMAEYVRESQNNGQSSSPGPLSKRRDEVRKEMLELEKKAQKVRAELPPTTWYDPFDKKSPKRPRKSKDGAFKLPLMPASRMKKAAEPEERSGGSDFLRGYTNEKHYWICPHDEDCNKTFESLVTYCEHLTQRGFITFKDASETNKTANIKLSDLRSTAKGM